MSSLVRPVLVACAVALLGACGEPETVESGEATVQRVADGDLLVLEGGVRVRLLQIDAPELGAGECYGQEAVLALDQLLQPGDEVGLEVDPRLDDTDHHGRLLRYVNFGSTNINVELARRGGATAFFRRGERGRYADALLGATEQARAKRRGMWSACRVEWDSRRQVQTRYP